MPSEFTRGVVCLLVFVVIPWALAFSIALLLEIALQALGL